MKDSTKFQEAAHLQAIESNPLDDADIAMFEMFEREGWPIERQIAHIMASEDQPLETAPATPAAE